MPYLVVFVKQGTTGTFYLNGEQDGSPSTLAAVTYNPTPLTIGGNGFNGFNFQGIMNQITIHSTARTSSEVADLYAAGPVQSCPFPTETPTRAPSFKPTKAKS